MTPVSVAKGDEKVRKHISKLIGTHLPRGGRHHKGVDIRVSDSFARLDAFAVPLFFSTVIKVPSLTLPFAVFLPRPFPCFILCFCLRLSALFSLSMCFRVFHILSSSGQIGVFKRLRGNPLHA